MQSRASVSAQAANMTCLGAIYRWKKGAGDYRKIIDSGKEFNDADFPADYTSIAWKGFTSGNTIPEDNIKWMKL